MELLMQKHHPVFKNGILGCDGFEGSDNLCCLIVKTNEFAHLGMKNNSIVYVNRKSEQKAGELNVFQTKNAYTISKQKEPEQQYIGRVIMALTLYNN